VFDGNIYANISVSQHYRTDSFKIIKVFTDCHPPHLTLFKESKYFTCNFHFKPSESYITTGRWVQTDKKVIFGDLKFMSAVCSQSTGIIVLMKCLLLGRQAVTEYIRTCVSQNFPQTIQASLFLHNIKTRRSIILHRN
jgi:hypothetical protein